MAKPWTPDEIIRAMDDVINDQPPASVGVLSDRQASGRISGFLGARCSELEKEFHVPGSHEPISEAGVERLKLLRAELIESWANPEIGNVGNDRKQALH